jgi:plasmid stabilization system protein ParE
MVRKIIWRKEARADLVAIKDYIARVSSLASAEKVVAAIEQAAEGLVHCPYKFCMIPEFQDPDRRETFVFEYRMMYRVEPTRIEILRVVHGRRLLKNVPGSFEEAPQADYTAA